jgi:hypothetical protein
MCDAAGCKRISAVWKFKIFYSSDSERARGSKKKSISRAWGGRWGAFARVGSPTREGSPLDAGGGGGG